MKRMLKSLILAMLATVILLVAYPFTSMAQVWTNLGLFGGEIKDIAIDPNNPNKMFAASYMGDGLFVTEDGGNTWRPVETTNVPEGEGTFKNHVVNAVKIAPSDSNVIWVAHDVWVEKSTDGGQTWTHIFNSQMQKDCVNCEDKGSFRFCLSLAIHPTNPQIVYVGTGGANNTYRDAAVYKTTDGGQTWTMHESILSCSEEETEFFKNAVVDLAIDHNNPDIIWAVTHSFGGGPEGAEYTGNLRRSENGGVNWKWVGGLSGSWDGYHFYDVEIDPNDSASIFTGHGIGVLRFNQSVGSDTCPPWKLQMPLDWTEGNYYSRYAKAVAFDPFNTGVVYAAWNNPWYNIYPKIFAKGTSPYAYENWEFHHIDYDFLAIAVHPTNSDIIIGGENDLGVFKSQDNGQTWLPINNGINAVIVYDVAIDPNDSTHVVVGTISGVYEKNGTADWSKLLSYSTNSIRFHPTDSLTFFAGIEGYLAKTINGGLNWAYNYVGVYSWVRDIAIDPVQTDTIYVAVGEEIRKSTDGGVTFSKVLDGINQSAEQYAFNVVVIDPLDHQHIFAGGGNFFAPKVLGDLWESTDGGTNWTRTGLTNVIVNALLINPNDSNIMYAGCGYSGGTGSDPTLYKSTDGGVTWVSSYDGIPINQAWNEVTDLEFHPTNKNFIYASTWRQGVFISPNQGGNWLEFGKPEYAVHAIATSSLYAASEGGLLQCTGTGCITGNITDAATGNPINEATIFSDLGGLSTLVINGQYMMISPSGICSVTAVAEGHANTTANYVTVWGGDVTNMDIQMQAGVPDYSPIPQTGITNASAGGYCFIATAAYGSPMAKQVEVLRKFRDRYLLPHVVGRKIVAFYYCTGKPIAMYIHSHPWLKSIVKGVLYPIVGLAWLLVATSAMTKGFICLCISLGVIWVIRRCIKMRSINKKSKLKYAPNIMMVLILTVLIFSGGRLYAGTLFQQVGIASSPNPVGSGARAVGMGGAFIAISDDATAASWNPAGLIQLEKPELSIVGSYVTRREDFSSTVRPETNNTGEVDERSINYLSAAYPFYFHKNMVVAINYQRLFEFNRSFAHHLDYSSAGVNLQQDKNFRQDGSLGALGIAASVEITPQLSFGATFNIWTDQFVWKNGWNDSFTEHAVGSTAGVPVTIDTLITDDYSRFRGLNVNVGMLWDINQYVTVGAVVKTPFTASLVHTYSFNQTQTFGPPTSTTLTSQQELEESIELEMPLSYGIGIAWRLSDAFTIDFDIYRTDWSDYILIDGQGNKLSPIDGRPESSSDVKDTTQIRFGGEYLFIKEGKKMVIPVRAGIFYDPEPSYGELKDFYGITVGSGIAYKKLIFDAAYQLRWGTDVDTGNLIATSEADMTQHLVLVSMIYHF